MTPNTLNELAMSPSWRHLASGAYHDVYHSIEPLTIDGDERLWVLKIPRAISEDIDSINRASRTKEKLSLVSHDYPVFHVDGYRLKVTGDAVPSNDLIQAGTIFIYKSSDICMAAFKEPSGNIERMVLNDRLDKEIVADIVNAISQDDKISFEYEGLIFQALGCHRECVLFPYFEDASVELRDISNAVIDIYKKSRVIIVDAEVEGNFLKDGDRTVCVDVDHAYRCNSPISKENLPDWLDITDYYSDEPTCVVEALLYLEEQVKSNAIDDKFLFLEFILKLHEFYEEDCAITSKTLDILFQVMEFSSDDLIDDGDITPALITRLEACNKKIDVGLVEQMIQALDTFKDEESDTISSSSHEYEETRRKRDREASSQASVLPISMFEVDTSEPDAAHSKRVCRSAHHLTR